MWGAGGGRVLGNSLQLRNSVYFKRFFTFNPCGPYSRFRFNGTVQHIPPVTITVQSWTAPLNHNINRSGHRVRKLCRLLCKVGEQSLIEVLHAFEANVQSIILHYLWLYTSTPPRPRGDHIYRLIHILPLQHFISTGQYNNNDEVPSVEK